MILENGTEVDVRVDETNPDNIVLEFIDPDEHGLWVLIAMPREKAAELGRELLDVKPIEGMIL